MASEAKVTAVIEAKDNASGVLSNLGSNFGSLGLKIAGVTAAAAAIYKGFTAIVDASSDAQVKIASMDATLQATGKSTAETRQKILDASQAFTKLGIDDEQAAKSMAVLFQRTNDVGQAIKLTSLAADLARAKQIDLESATKLVSLALSGQGRALMQYGIQIKDSATPLEALGELQKAVGGQAEAFSKTFKGQGEVLTQTWDNFKQLLGDIILPALTQGMGALILVVQNLAQWITNIYNRVVQFAESTGLLDVWRMAWDNISSTFNNNFLPALSALWEALQPLMPFLKAMAQVLGVVLVGAIIVLTQVLTVVINTFTALLTTATNVATFLTTVFGASINFVIDKVSTLIGWIQKAVEWIGKLSFSSVTSSIGNVFGGNTPSPGKPFGSAIPGFAEGGIVPGAIGAPMLAVVHGGERVIPNGGASGGISITITGNNISSALDIRYLAEQVSGEVMRSLRRMQQV